MNLPELRLRLSDGASYRRFLLFITSLGGLLYGADIGIIAAALLYLNRTIDLSLQQTSLIVAAVLGGSMLSSLAAGILADRFGRKKMMVASGLIFVLSIALIVLSHAFVGLFCGRLLQGISGGFIAVVVPLYLAECLSAEHRGRGTALFQFMLTFGIVISALVGWLYTRQAEAAISLAGGNRALIAAAQDRAWRGMFLSVLYPGLLFFAGSFALSETPRWLLRKGRKEAAWKALLRSSSRQEAQRVWDETERGVAHRKKDFCTYSDSLWRRKYIVPFVLACVVLACTQATGINSILSFLVIVLRQAGMSARHATQGDLAVKLLNCGMTLLGVALVDKKGRRFLMQVGTAGLVLALLLGALIFLRVESKTTDVKRALLTAQTGNKVTLPVTRLAPGARCAEDAPVLTVVYSYGAGDRIATVSSDSSDPVLRIAPEAANPKATLLIRRAGYGPTPRESTGWLMAACIALFVSSFAFGPGVVVWLTLSELMPSRIRSVGMGIALLLNQGVSTAIAALFLPIVGNYGYSAMFFFWTACTAGYFISVTLFLPETKGKTLEEIEQCFAGSRGATPMPANEGVR